MAERMCSPIWVAWRSTVCSVSRLLIRFTLGKVKPRIDCRLPEWLLS